MLRNILSKLMRFGKKSPLLTVWLVAMVGSIIALLIVVPADRWDEPLFSTREEAAQPQRPAISTVNIGSGDQVVATGQAVVVNRGTVVTSGPVPTVVVHPTTTVHPTVTVNGVTVVMNDGFTYNPLIQVGSSHICDCDTEHFAPLVITNGNYFHRCDGPAPGAETYANNRTISSVSITQGDYICRCEWGHGGPVTITGGQEICLP